VGTCRESLGRLVCLKRNGRFSVRILYCPWRAKYCIKLWNKDASQVKQRIEFGTSRVDMKGIMYLGSRLHPMQVLWTSIIMIAHPLAFFSELCNYGTSGNSCIPSFSKYFHFNDVHILVEHSNACHVEKRCFEIASPKNVFLQARNSIYNISYLLSRLHVYYVSINTHFLRSNSSNHGMLP